MIVYSLFSNFICSFVTDRVVLGNNKYYDVSIITDDIFCVTEYIGKALGRNVTFVQCMDSENVSKKMMIKTVISKSELARFKIFMKEKAEDSFVYVTESAGVIGSDLKVVKKG